MLDFDVKVDEFCRKLVNEEIHVSEIPDACFIAVAKRVMYNLPATTMEAVVERLKIVVATKAQELVQKKCELEKLEQQMQQFDNAQCQ